MVEPPDEDVSSHRGESDPDDSDQFESVSERASVSEPATKAGGVDDGRFDGTEVDDAGSPGSDESSEPEAPSVGTTPENGGIVGTHAGWGVNDQRTEDDHLDFEAYVSVLHEFLTHPRTKPPLTVSIEGEWGTGKSSFMALLRKAIRDGDRTRGTRYFTVEFNPWRHEREDALWAAFMLEFFHQITDQLGFRDRWTGHLRLVRRRIEWRHGWRDLLRLGLVVPLVLLALLFPSVATGLGIPLTDLGLAVGQGVSVVALGVWVWQNVADPIETELQSYIADPEYENRVSFIERFHGDFEGILDAYLGTDSRVFVFIDDLDRCPPSKAAELVQSINLMISSGDSRVFFVLGMDREKVAAGLAAKHEGLLEYLRASEARDVAGNGSTGVAPDGEAGAPETGAYDSEHASGNGTTPVRPDYSTEAYGLEFADNYLEKFVQIPFLIPKPREEGIGRLVEQMVGGEGTPGAEEVDLSGSSVEELRGLVAGLDSVATLRTLVERERRGGNRDLVLRLLHERLEELGSGGTRGPGRPDDRDAEEDVLPKADLVRIGEMVAPVFDYNPRTVKTFVNLYRLRTMLASELGLFRDGTVTREQLAKFVAIGLEWPALTESMRDPERAAALTEWALSDGDIQTAAARGKSRRAASSGTPAQATLRSKILIAPAPATGPNRSSRPASTLARVRPWRLASEPSGR